ncbi:MAG: hypothetical protein PHE55_16490 [Methylococcaceae bacterium]|nr:hypothetical protein [Methylococcaceae bacterium]
MRKLIAPLLTLLLVLGLAAGIYVSVGEQLTQQRTVTVRGLIGSEKEDFFRDPRVVEALAKKDLAVELEKAGSRQIATQFKLKDYDFAFPSGAPAAEKIKREAGVNKAYEVFFTPMAVASWKLIADILEANNIVRQREGVYYIIDLTRLLQFVIAEKRWSDLSKNEGYSVKKNLLVSTTDVRQSNSAGMYLSLASYILNNNNIVDSTEQIGAIIQPLESLFLRQGFVENSSATPFKDYLVMGPGKAPLVMIYEAQYLEEASSANSGLSGDMTLLYPEPTIFSKHILVPFNDKGNKLGAALTDDPELQKLAIEHGFRNRDAAGFRSFVKNHQLAVPDTLVNVVEPPTFEILEQMIMMIEQRYKRN